MTDPAVLRRLVEQWREELHRETNAARYTLLDRCIYQVNAVLAMECGVPRNRNLVARWRDEGGAWTVSEMAGFIEELLAALALSVDRVNSLCTCGVLTGGVRSPSPHCPVHAYEGETDA